MMTPLGPTGRIGELAELRNKLAPLLFRCAKTVYELHLFEPLGFLVELKQIPQIVVIVRNSRETKEYLKATRAPYKQEVRSSSLRPPSIPAASQGQCPSYGASAHCIPPTALWPPDSLSSLQAP
jgi:hypothetical protein